MELVLKIAVFCSVTGCQDLIQNVILYCFIECQDLTSPESNSPLSDSVSRLYRTRVEDCSNVVCCIVPGLIQNVAFYCVKVCQDLSTE